VKTISIITALKAAAIEDHRDTGTLSVTGVAIIGPVRCHYFPVSARHMFWLHGEVTSLAKLRAWLRREGWR
jgi:hypothetical protein